MTYRVAPLLKMQVNTANSDRIFQWWSLVTEEGRLATGGGPTSPPALCSVTVGNRILTSLTGRDPCTVPNNIFLVAELLYKS